MKKSWTFKNKLKKEKKVKFILIFYYEWMNEWVERLKKKKKKKKK